MGWHLSGRRRSWLPLRTSVRTLMALVAVVGGGGGWSVHHIRVQHEATELIRRNGGYVQYQYESDSVSYEQATHGWRQVPRTVFGRWYNEACEPVSRVTMDRHRGSSAWLEALAHFRGLWSISARDARVTDSDLVAIGRLEGCVDLELDENPITDAGLVHLSQLDHLAALNLTKTDIADDGLATLARFGHLSWLMLEGTRVTDAGLASISRSRSVETLNLRETRITDAGLVHLARMASLRHLNLEATAVTGDGLRFLAGMADPPSLSFEGGEVGERDWPIVRSLPPGSTLAEVGAAIDLHQRPSP